ncbi:hypothetical protein E4T44_02657, partial [Aureobasidium sp. EXF-8845]
STRFSVPSTRSTSPSSPRRVSSLLPSRTATSSSLAATSSCPLRDSCPSPSPLLVLPRLRSPLVVEVHEVDSATVDVVVVASVIVDVGALAVEVVEVRRLAQEVAASAEVAAIVDVEDFLLAAVREASVAVEVVVVVEATKCLASHLDTPKSAKHEGVNRQRRHGVIQRPKDGLWEMVAQMEALFS